VNDRGTTTRGGRGRRAIELALALSATGLLGLVVLSSFTRPVFPFDAWSYHLPFASRLFGIGGGSEAFVLGPWNQLLFDGFPLAAEWLQGALWWLGGSLRFATGVNSLSLAGLILYAVRSFRLPVAPLVFGMLAVPMVAIHATTGLIDLFVASCLALQALAAIRCLELSREASTAEAAHRWRRHALLFLVAATFAGNAKYMGLALSWVICAFVLANSFSRAIPRRRARALAVTALTAAILAAGFFWRNLVVFGNGLYPAPPKRLAVDYRPPERIDGQLNPHRSYTSRLGLLQRPVEFVLSLTEVDWKIRGVEPLYNVDSNTGDKPRRFQRIRSGGWWGPYMIFLLLWLGASLTAHRRARWTTREKLFVRLFAVLTLAIAFLPASPLLRYWMVWPLLLVIVVTQLHAADGSSARALALTCSVALALGWSYSELPTTADFRVLPVRRFDVAVMRRRVDPVILRAADDGKSFCLGAEHYPGQFRVSRALIGGNHSVEQVEMGGECQRFPKLEVEAPMLQSRRKRHRHRSQGSRVQPPGR